MASTKIGSLFGDVTLNTKGLQRGVKNAKRHLADFQSSTKKVATGILKVSTPLAAMGVVATKSFADFEKGATEVQSLLPDFHTTNFRRLIEDTRELATVMGTDLNDATSALYQTISAGVDPNNAITFLEASSMSAIAGVTDITTAVDGLSTVLNAYGMEARDTMQISDQMFTAVRLGKTTFEEISGFMFQAVPLAAAMGVKFEELMAILISLTKQGVPTRTAFTQIRAAMSNLMKPTADMTKALKALGVETAQELISQRGLVGAFQAIRMESGLTSQELGKAFGSVEGLSAVLATTGAMFGETNAALASVRGGAGATTKAFEVMSNTLSFKFNQLKATVQDLAIAIGERLNPFVSKFIELAKRFIQDNKEAIVELSELGAILGAILPPFTFGLIFFFLRLIFFLPLKSFIVSSSSV